MDATKRPATEPIRLPKESANGLYVAFEPTPERVARGARYGFCRRCGKIIGHWPQQSAGHEVICLNCAHDVPAIHRHLEQLAKSREC